MKERRKRKKPLSSCSKIYYRNVSWLLLFGNFSEVITKAYLSEITYSKLTYFLYFRLKVDEEYSAEGYTKTICTINECLLKKVQTNLISWTHPLSGYISVLVKSYGEGKTKTT